MSKKPNQVYIWVDDSPDREEMARQIAKRLGVSVLFRNVKNRQLEDEITSLRQQPKPDLILVDHFLDASKTDGVGISKGSTVAEALREAWAQCPILGITAAKKRHNVDYHRESIYDEMFSYPEFVEAIDYLPIIVQGFKSLSHSRIGSAPGIIAHLKAPKIDRNRIASILPDTLKRDFDDKSLSSRLFKWIRSPFLHRPGFLYDRLWAATIVGLKLTSFPKVERLFVDALYRGVFAVPQEPHWWGSELRRIVYAACPNSEGRLPWEVGRGLPGVTSSDYSKCYVSGEPLPEVVGYIDEESDERYPMRLNYTVPHPRYEKLLFFEEIRMMGERTT